MSFAAKWLRLIEKQWRGQVGGSKQYASWPRRVTSSFPHCRKKTPPPDISQGRRLNTLCPFGLTSSPLLAVGIIGPTDPGDSICLCPCQCNTVLINAEGHNVELIPEDRRLLLWQNSAWVMTTQKNCWEWWTAEAQQRECKMRGRLTVNAGAQHDARAPRRSGSRC